MIVKCPVCGEPYRIPETATELADYSACQDCVEKAEEKEKRHRNKPKQF